ncbi:AAA family ATPase [Myxococcus faecalis]|uniref:AAA family ATPase n=1 Tax=Myxococcus faecalis TaxID=3115646 RepID=UPI0038D1A7DA
MSQRIPEDSLPTELTPFQAVEAAYPAELERTREALLRGLPVMVEADKELTPYFYKCLRDRLKKDGKQFLYLDGRAAAEPPPGMPAPSMMATLIGQLRDAVRGAVRERIVVLPHLDLLTTSSGGLTSEAREVIPLLYENPEMVWVGFKDPSFPLPRVIENLFPHKETLLGVSRERLRHLVTQRECRKFGRGLQPYVLYKHVSGVNAVRLRRLLGAITGEDYPSDARPAYAQLRSATLSGSLNVPDLDLRADIGGYTQVKDRLQREILDVLAHKDTLSDPEAVKRVEGLLPRGMIFWGPPGTGKTLFAKAMASSLGAAVLVVSGPELKSRWVGESEENLRQIFVRARQAAPSIIIFDELDSFASARGTYTGSGVEHSMVNQLLTEMDGFRKEELVFVVGTTNFVESLDPALLRPGRFEFQLCIPYPNNTDRRAILSIYNEKLALGMTERALDYAVKRTGDRVEGTGTRFSGDHIQALCRALARRRLREGAQTPTEPVDVERALTDYLDRPALTPTEERVVATHEAGHAVCALFCPSAPAIDRISIRGDLAGTLGFVQYADPAHRHVVTRGQLLDSICMLFGGREAEALLLEDLSIGSAHDLERATEIARELVEELGMGGDGLPVRRFDAPGRNADRHALSDATRGTLEAATLDVLEVQRARARDILRREKPRLVALRDLLLERKVLDREAFVHLAPEAAPKKEPAHG